MPCLTRTTSKALAIAVEIILIAQEDKDPYEIASHVEGCDECIWDEEVEGDVLLPSDVIADKACPVCLFNWDVIDEILEKLGDVKYYDMALEAFDDRAYIDDAKPPVNEIELERFEYARTVAREINKLEIQRQQQQAQQARQQSNQQHG